MPRGRAQEKCAGSHGFFEAADNVFDRQSACVEELFHEFVISLGDHFDQGFVRRVGCGFLRSGDVAFFAFAVALGLVAIRFHADEINNAGESFLFAERQMHGNRCAAETVRGCSPWRG